MLSSLNPVVRFAAGNWPIMPWRWGTLGPLRLSTRDTPAFCGYDLGASTFVAEDFPTSEGSKADEGIDACEIARWRVVSKGVERESADGFNHAKNKSRRKHC
jgi:hypothetical protein